MDLEVFVRNLKKTDRRTFIIVVWEGSSAFEFVTYQAMFISLVTSIIMCICCVKIMQSVLHRCCYRPTAEEAGMTRA